MNTNHSLTIEQTIRSIAEEVYDERERINADTSRSSATNNAVVDSATQEKINTYELLSRKPYLTRKEAALYLNVSECSIVEWSNRRMDENPFPETYAGGNPRYRREDIDKWISRERGRVRLKSVG